MMKNRIAIQGKYSADYLQKCHLRAVIDNKKKIHAISFPLVKFSILEDAGRWYCNYILWYERSRTYHAAAGCAYCASLCMPISNNRSTVLCPQA